MRKRRSKYTPPFPPLNKSKDLSEVKNTTPIGERWCVMGTGRNPHTGQLIGRGRHASLAKIHALRDSLIAIKRYLYRRICTDAFPPLQMEVPKGDLRRLSMWLQPTKFAAPTSTEKLCYNATSGNPNGLLGGGTPSILIPTSQKADREFFLPTYGRLKDRIFSKKRFPVGLLDLLTGKSSKERRESDVCLTLPLRVHEDTYSRQLPCNSKCGRHGTVAILRIANWLPFHSGNSHRADWPLLTNKLWVLGRNSPFACSLEKQGD